uniref:Centrosomal protein CCDC61 n=1 Tax=Callorhinchus milii TaxID=7868 RepID=V9KNN3_CALMI
MEGGGGVQTDYVFRGIEYVVSMAVSADVLEVEIQDQVTADQWRGEFEASYIEDVTHKTGNFKQFSIFCNMLESAVTKSSQSVTLDLLTYSDLELLRSRKAGAGVRHVPPPKSPSLNAKRYLILIYSVEFDRIHYPLPLPYVGKPDPVALQKLIRELKVELAAFQTKQGKDYQEAELRRLRSELGAALKEKQEAQVAVLQLQEELDAAHGEAGHKELKLLKKIIGSLEQGLLLERNKHQKVLGKRGQEYRQLREEFEQLKASERTLRVRVKNLTNELAFFRRGRVTPVGPSAQNRSALSSGRRSQPRSGSGAREERRSSSRERALQWSRERERARERERERSTSRDRSSRWLDSQASQRERSSSRESESRRERGTVPRHTPSPTGSRVPRFDPTAYVQDKERKQREAEVKNARPMRGRSSSQRRRIQSRLREPDTRLQTGNRAHSSTETLRSRYSSSDLSDLEDSRPRLRSRGNRKAAQPLGSASWNTRNVPRSKANKTSHLASTPSKTDKASNKENYFDPCDLSEIDARLSALQEYMKSLDTRTA